MLRIKEHPATTQSPERVISQIPARIFLYCFIIPISELCTLNRARRIMWTNRVLPYLRPPRPPYRVCTRSYATTPVRRRKQDPKYMYSPPHVAKEEARRVGFLSLVISLITTWEVVYLFGYEPLKDRGFFDAAAQSTIFRLIGPKKVSPKRNVIQQSEPPLYQPITGKTEIRLLTLEPGQPDEEIKCSLVNVKLSWRTRYEALSYTWGDPTVTMPIKLSGHDVEVTSNLHSALKDLRYTDKPRCLWVDAVCINQTDLQEKGQQILLMGSIYSHARRVLIYLGPTDSDVGQAMKTIGILNSKMKALHFGRYMSRLNSLGSWVRVLFDYLPSQRPLPEDFDWGPVVKLLQRPWFERTWIIQEAILARRGLVICGDKSVPWLTFERVAHDIYMYHYTVKAIPSYHLIHDAVEGLDMMRLARRDQRRLHSMSVSSVLNVGGALHEYTKLLDLLFDTREFLCSNHRDKIYGLLGVTNENIHNKYIIPDYTLSVEEVFKSFVLWEVLNNRNLRVLGFNSDTASTMYSLPSWTPDFTKLSHRKPLLRREKRVSFSSGGNTTVEAQLSEDGTLCLKGQIMDTVHTVATAHGTFSNQIYIPSSPPKRVIGEQKQLQWYCDLRMKEKWLTEVLSIATATFDRLEANKMPLLRFYTPTKSTTTIQILGKPRRPEWELLWRTLTCNHTVVLSTVPSYYREWVIAYTDLVRGGLQAKEDFVQTWLARAQQVENGIAYFAQGRRFAGTEGGLIGWVPEETVEGDIVVIPYGSRVPFVVRNVSEGKYRLIGECYIHGLMDGQAIYAKGRQDRETVISLV
ncbi:heterokaryon incompatibility protein-domain-containing protein [Xylaria sp. FL1042]|nr:heterokaryon incompatibility protein-domain-containing protein [Xylaria sp. FL1042]